MQRVVAGADVRGTTTPPPRAAAAAAAQPHDHHHHHPSHPSHHQLPLSRSGDVLLADVRSTVVLPGAPWDALAPRMGVAMRECVDELAAGDALRRQVLLSMIGAHATALAGLMHEYQPQFLSPPYVQDEQVEELRVVLRPLLARAMERRVQVMRSSATAESVRGHVLLAGATVLERAASQEQQQTQDSSVTALTPAAEMLAAIVRARPQFVDRCVALAGHTMPLPLAHVACAARWAPSDKVDAAVAVIMDRARMLGCDIDATPMDSAIAALVQRELEALLPGAAIARTRHRRAERARRVLSRLFLWKGAYSVQQLRVCYAVANAMHAGSIPEVAVGVGVGGADASQPQSVGVDAGATQDAAGSLTERFARANAAAEARTRADPITLEAVATGTLLDELAAADLPRVAQGVWDALGRNDKSLALHVRSTCGVDDAAMVRVLATMLESAWATVLPPDGLAFAWHQAVEHGSLVVLPNITLALLHAMRMHLFGCRSLVDIEGMLTSVQVNVCSAARLQALYLAGLRVAHDAGAGASS